MAYPTANITFSELVAHARAFDAIGDCSGALAITLIYNLKGKPKYGDEQATCLAPENAILRLIAH